MKQIRRLQAAPGDVFAKAQRGALRHMALPKDEFHALERERPGLIIVDGEAVLIGWPASGAINLRYAYPDHGAFSQQFPAMLRQVLEKVDRAEAPIGVCLRLIERSARMYIEPVLLAHAFELVREWCEMTVLELPEAGRPNDELADGFGLRPARSEDADAIVELDALSFVVPSLTREVARDQIERAPELRVLEDAARGRVAGYLQLGIRAEATGHLAELVVHPDYRRRGLGEAMLRWSLGRFRDRGLRRATLTVNTDNAPAIALYRKLGFETGEIGIDYRRPIDEEEARQVIERRLTSHVRVRSRF